MPKGIGQLLIDDQQLVPRVHRAVGAPDGGNLLIFNAESAAKQPRLVPGRQPDQFLADGFDAAEYADESRQTQDKIKSFMVSVKLIAIICVLVRQ
jgi:hypothetical protein